MKVAALMEAFDARGGFDPMLVHTGQHYDERMSDLFFRQLGLPQPDANLEVGSGTHAVQTAEVMQRFEPLVVARKPDWVIVVGDVNSTLAAALVAAKLGVRIAHVEAGLRSFDRRMPEEINRVLTDTLSDLLLASEPSGVENLQREGIAGENVQFVGNVMVDTLMKHRARAEQSQIRMQLEVGVRRYAVVTLHRPENVDDPARLSEIVAALGQIGEEIGVIFPVHPRTRKNLQVFDLDGRLKAFPQVRLIEPLGYLEYLKLMADSAVVLTDSGGVQEETTILGVPCLTLRETTERPATISHGTNRLVPFAAHGRPRREAIVEAYREATKNPFELGSLGAIGRRPPLWDGRSGPRIAECLLGAG